MKSADARFAIVNADDFGLSPGVNRGVIRGHREGLVTSASLMVKKDWSWQAVRMAAHCPNLSLGLHLDLGEWRFHEGEWVAHHVATDLTSKAAVERELLNQLHLFQEMVGRNPTHLDSHQHAHNSPSVRSIAIAMAEELRVPLRHCVSGLRYCGRFYGQTNEGRMLPELITPDALIRLFRNLGPGWTEVACHPSDTNDSNDVYCDERMIELATLCDPEVRKAIREESVILCSFHDWLLARRPSPGPIDGHE